MHRRYLDIRYNDFHDKNTFIKFLKIKHGLANTKYKSPQLKGQQLCKELKEIEAGKKGWAQYETNCVEIIKYLFSDDLAGFYQQTRTADDLNRFDLVCRALSKLDFWSFIVSDIQSRYVVFEFKNYKKAITQKEVLTTEKYLMEKGLRRFSIILTRKGADENARQMIKGAMREQGKLLLVLDDEEICEMLHMKDKGEEPSDALFDKVDEFLMTLPR